MTRKHFNALASELNYARPVGSLDDNRVMGWQQAVEAVGKAYKGFNPAFDRTRFRAACGADR